MLGSLLQQRFHLDGILRQGRSGVAYVATDEATGELFAVKVFARGAGIDGASGHAYRARLLQLEGLNHAHLVVATAVGQHDGQWYEAAPYFPGDPGAGEPGAPGLAAGEAIEVLRQLAEGLAALHETGTVHGGILPRRVLVSRVDGVHAVLLGAARHLLSAGQAVPPADAPFSAPEQDPRHQLPVDLRADLYALGALALGILTGAAETAAGHTREAAPVPRPQWAGIAAERARSAPEVPAVLRPILGRLLAVNPEDRYPSASHLLAELQGIGYGASAPLPARQVPPRLSRGTLPELEAPGRAIQERFDRVVSGQGGAVVLQAWEGAGLERVLHGAIAIASPEQIVPEGTAGIVSGRIRGLARLGDPNDRRQTLERYYEALQRTLGLHRMTLVARGQAGWCAVSPTGPLGAFWAMQSILPLVSEFDAEIAGDGEVAPALLRTGIGLHAAMLSAPRGRRSAVLSEPEAEPFEPHPGSPWPRPAQPAAEAAQPSLLAGEAFTQAARLADLSAFLRAGAVFSPEMTASLPPAWNATLRCLGPWRVGPDEDPRELFAFAAAPGAGAAAPGLAGLPAWNRALGAYRARDWRNAIAALKSFLEERPGDRLARLLLRHSRRRDAERPAAQGAKH